MEAFRERVKIYATDVDEEALAVARHGTLRHEAASRACPRSCVERYFEGSDGRYAFRKDLRRTMIFGRNDLVQDAPISRIDLLVCRNTLMYFNAETQSRILAPLPFRAEPTRGLPLPRQGRDAAHPRANSSRLWTQAPGLPQGPEPSLRDRLLCARPSGDDGEPRERRPASTARSARSTSAGRRRSSSTPRASSCSPTSRRARSSPRAADLGRPLQDLEISYRPVELRSHHRAGARGAPAVSLDERRVGVRGRRARARRADRRTPLSTTATAARRRASRFIDVTRQHGCITSSSAPSASSRRLRGAAVTNEELETTNEELQSTNEELETTNEELQSTNEELETMNEELQSTNEELETINDELRQRSDESNT